MWESKGFIVFVVLLSLVLLYANGKALFFDSYEKCKSDIDESRLSASQFGKWAIGIFTGITVIVSVGYVVIAHIMGAIPATVLYVLVIFNMGNFMLENMCLKEYLKYNRLQFFYDKIQRVASVGLSALVLVTVFTTIRPF